MDAPKSPVFAGKNNAADRISFQSYSGGFGGSGARGRSPMGARARAGHIMDSSFTSGQTSEPMIQMSRIEKSQDFDELKLHTNALMQ